MADIQFDIRTDRALEHGVEIAKPLAEVDRLRQQRLLARKGQQLSHKALGAIGRILDLHHVLVARIGRAEIPGEQIREANNGLQMVVEIMRDAAASWPTAFIFMDWKSCSCSFFSSVVSSA